MMTKTDDVISKSWYGSLCRGVARLLPFPVPRTRAARRRLVTGYVGMAAVVPILCGAVDSAIPLLVLGPLVALLVIALGLSVDLITDRPTSALDERERRVRDSALSRPLEIGVVLGVAIGFLAQWAFENDGPFSLAVLTSVTTVALSIRLIAIAWTMPDSIGDE